MESNNNNIKESTSHEQQQQQRRWLSIDLWLGHIVILSVFVYIIWNATTLKHTHRTNDMLFFAAQTCSQM